VEAAAAALEAELSANLREQQRDLQDRLAGASSSVDAATLEARRRELAQVCEIHGVVCGRAVAWLSLILPHLYLLGIFCPLTPTHPRPTLLQAQAAVAEVSARQSAVEAELEAAQRASKEKAAERDRLRSQAQAEDLAKQASEGLPACAVGGCGGWQR